MTTQDPIDANTTRRAAIKKGLLSTSAGLVGIPLFAGNNMATQTHNNDIEFIDTYGGIGAAVANSLVQMRDGGFALAGSTNPGSDDGDFLLVKTDKTGTEELSKTYGGSKIDEANSLVQTRDGGFALAGRTRSFGASRGDFWLVKTDKAGDEELTQTYGRSGIEEANDVIPTRDGGFALAGYRNLGGHDDGWIVKTDEEGNEEFTQSYGGNFWNVATSLVQTSEGGFAIAGWTTNPATRELEFWLVKIDDNGDEEFARTFGGPQRDQARSIVQTRDGGFALAGQTSSFGAGDADFWLVKTDREGNQEFARAYGRGGSQTYDRANSVIQTRDSGFALAGYTDSGLGTNLRDLWFVKTDKNGTVESSMTIGLGDHSSETATSVVQSRDGGYVLAGWTRSRDGSNQPNILLVKINNIS